MKATAPIPPEAEPLPSLSVGAVIPQQYVQPGISIAQLIATMKTCWRYSIVIAVVVASLLAVRALTMPKSYTSRATMMVNFANNDPLAGDQLPMQLLANYVATQTEMLTSPVVLRAVVERLNLSNDRDYLAGFRGDLQSQREVAEKSLSSVLTIVEGRGGQLLHIETSARTAAKAALLANTVLDVYLEQERQRLNDPAAERVKRYSDQIVELRTKVAAAEDAVSAFRSQKGLSGVTAGNSEIASQNLADLEKRLVDAQNSRRGIEARAQQLPTASDAAMASSLVTTLRERLASQQVQLAEMRNTYGANHPKIRSLEAQVAATRQSLAEQLRALSDNGGEQLRSARRLEGELSTAVDKQREVVLSVRQLEDRGGKLQLELESAKAVYKRALDGYDQVLFASSGDHTNVSVVSRAVAPVKANTSGRAKLLATGVVAGIGLGIALPLLFQLLFNRRIRCREDFERDFGVPVLVELDALPAEGVFT